MLASLACHLAQETPLLIQSFYQFSLMSELFFEINLNFSVENHKYNQRKTMKYFAIINKNMITLLILAVYYNSN
ncbi:MAG: hypothetical protein A2W22_01920 [Candidatus Levybacteria bacterium RBG_16_35_11]|nr:MAG: hypothetical protein A2W22_01920 [Candidatus Levybacteria bacterium RBG_16_35_11]